MKRFSYFLLGGGILINLLGGCNLNEPKNLPSAHVTPTQDQVAYQQQELIGFIHFTVNTFTNKEWGYGDESPEIFNPTNLDTEQWAKVASEAGMKELILTAKHHDGFCLWPSKYTEHSVANSPYQDGQGDIVKEFTAACRKYGLKPGLYLSPWDRNHAKYGQPEYIEYYRNQLVELLTNYGEIAEVWFDGANGGDGYYGGANEERRIDKTTYYDWDSTWALVKKLQPKAMIFSDAGPDVHWIGNEKGIAGETFWSTMSTDEILPGQADQEYLNTGDPDGDKWIIGQCDVSIRPGWFYHPAEDSLVKSAEYLADLYYKSVGRNGILLLNLPPDRRGLIHENDVKNLKGFREILDQTFAEDYADGAEATASNFREQHQKFSPQNVLDGDLKTFWTVDDDATDQTLTLKLAEPAIIDQIMLQEPIHLGQRISAFTVEGLVEGEWQPLSEATTIGYKRLLRFDPVELSELRVIIRESRYTPAIAEIGLYRSPSIMEGKELANKSAY